MNEKSTLIEDSESLIESSSESIKSFPKFILGTIINPVSRLLKKGNIIKMNPLSSSDRNNLKQAGFSIFFVAFMLTIFEIVFFYMVVIPGVNKSRDHGLKNLGNILAEKLNKLKNTTKQEVKTTDPISEEELFKIFFGVYAVILEDENSLDNITTTAEQTTQSQDLESFENKNIIQKIIKKSNIKISKELDKDDDISDTKLSLIESINESDMIDTNKKHLIDFINDPVDFQIKKKKLLLELLNSDIDESNPVLETMAYREGLLRSKINGYVLITGILIVLVLFRTLLKLRKSVKSDTGFINGKYSDGFKTAKITAVFTILVLVSFQYSFFLLSKKYLFTISGIRVCNDSDINSFINIMKLKGKTFTRKQAKDTIFEKSIKSEESYFNLEFPGSPEVCSQHGATSIDNNMCSRRFHQCHYLSEDIEKYGSGDNELEMLALNKL
tara:strand:- start:1720 stop:3045 length:1326 start_codon:yes stop_codon:yes gene_type:complete